MKKLLTVILIGLLLPLTSFASVGYYGSSAFNAYTNSVSGSFDAGSGSQRGIVAVIMTSNGTPSTGSATYGGVSMTRNQIYTTAYGSMVMYSLPNPASGSNTFSYSETGATAMFAHVHAFTGVDQTSVIEATSTGYNSSGTTVNLSVDTISNDAWTISLARNAAGGSSGASYTAGTQTLRINNFYGGYYQSMSGDSNGSLGAPGTKTITASPGGSSSIIWGIIGAIKPYAETVVTANPIIEPIITWW